MAQTIGMTENAGLGNRWTKSQGWKMRTWKLVDQITYWKMQDLENDGPNHRIGKYTGHGKKSTGLENARPGK